MPRDEFCPFHNRWFTDRFEAEQNLIILDLTLNPQPSCYSGMISAYLSSLPFDLLQSIELHIRWETAMRKLMIFLITLCLTLNVTGVAIADIYKWVDETGTIHFSSSPPGNVASKVKVLSIPTHEYDSQPVNQTEQEDHNLNASSYPSPSTTDKIKSRKSSTPDFYVTPGRNTAKVELYSTSWCTYCQKARDFFRSRGILFTEYDIEKDRSAALRKRQLDRRQGVPLAIINGRRIHGYSEAAYTRALGGNP